MSSEVARVLRKAADLIEPPGRWTTRALARDVKGSPVDSASPVAVCWCALGALQRVTGRDVSCRWDAQDVLESTISTPRCTPTISYWNDSQGQAEVVATLRAAADEAERSDV